MNVKDRLTAHNKAGQGIINMDGVSDVLEASARIRTFSPLIISKLTEYEDTGLSPDEVNALKSENAAMRERLEKAVELPCEVGSTVYSISETDEEDNFNPWIDAGRVVSFSIDVNLWIYVRYNSGLTMWYTKDSFDEEVYITLEEAEARLAELKGGAK